MARYKKRMMKKNIDLTKGLKDTFDAVGLMAKGMCKKKRRY